MAEQLERLYATALSVQDLAVSSELDLLLISAEPLALIIRKECLARKKAVSEVISRPSSM